MISVNNNLKELKKELENKRSMLEFRKTLQKDLLERKESIIDVWQTALDDMHRVKMLKNIIKTYYNSYKMKKMSNIQEALGEFTKLVFGDSHKFRLDVSVDRGNTNVNLVSVRDNGDSSGHISVTTSDAEQQLIGYTFQGIVLKEMNSDMILLDEAFSSFGIEEVKTVPTIIGTMRHFQHVIIEHKPELFDELQNTDLDIQYYKLRNSNGTVTVESNENEKTLSKWLEEYEGSDKEKIKKYIQGDK